MPRWAMYAAVVAVLVLAARMSGLLGSPWTHAMAHGHFVSRMRGASPATASVVCGMLKNVDTRTHTDTDTHTQHTHARARARALTRGSLNCNRKQLHLRLEARIHYMTFTHFYLFPHVSANTVTMTMAMMCRHAASARARCRRVRPVASQPLCVVPRRHHPCLRRMARQRHERQGLFTTTDQPLAS